MKRIIALIVVGSFIFSFNCEASTKRPSALAIEWWLREQDKFEGVKINTKQLPDGKYDVTNWEVIGIQKPTDVELEVIINDYEQYLKDKDKSQKEKVIRVKTKLKELGILQDDLDAIIKD